jgi:hypothetical protein
MSRIKHEIKEITKTMSLDEDTFEHLRGKLEHMVVVSLIKSQFMVTGSYSVNSPLIIEFKRELDIKW